MYPLFVMLRAGRPEFDFRQGQEIFLFSVASGVLGPTEPEIQLLQGVLFPGVKRKKREDDYSPAPTAEVKNGGAIPPLPLCLHGTVLNYIINYGDNFFLSTIC
jgi:hypothetical protein